MTVRALLRMGDPLLRQLAQPVMDCQAPYLVELVADLQDTMEANSGAGLAAPQIGIPLRVVIFGGGGPNLRYPDAPPVPFTVLINPELKPLGEERTLGWEGCLSVPGLRGEVKRWNRLRYCGWTPEGSWLDRTVDGFHARVVQHECDHLDGVLFPDRLDTPQAFGFIAELEQSGRIPMVPS